MKTDTIFAGTSYHCSLANKAHFYLDASLDGHWKYEIIWSVSGQSSNSTFMTGNVVSTINGNAQDAILQVGADEKGFILSAEMTVYNGNTEEVYKKYKGTRNVKVFNRVDIVEPPDTVYLNHSYPIETHAVISSIGQDGYVENSLLLEGEGYACKAEPKQQELSNSAWTVHSNAGEDVIITSEVYRVPNVLNPDSNFIAGNKTVHVLEPDYVIQGSDVMPDIVARVGSDLSYIYNNNPYEESDQAVCSRMYWLEDSCTGEFVKADSWDVDYNGNTLTFTANVTVGGKSYSFTKTVNVVSIHINKPDDSVLIKNMAYDCQAQLSFGTANECSWEASGGIIAESRLTPTADKVALTVRDYVSMSNKLGSNSYEITDTRNYYVADKVTDSKWEIKIITVGDNNNGIINIPADQWKTTDTTIEAEVTNPGQQENKFSDKSTEYQWKLYIPALNTWIQNGSITPSGSNSNATAVLPSGDGKDKAYEGTISIRNWTFPSMVNTLPGILYVECKANNKLSISTRRMVSCVIKN